MRKDSSSKPGRYVGENAEPGGMARAKALEASVAGVESAKEGVAVHEAGKETSGRGSREDRLCQPLQRTLLLL